MALVFGSSNSASQLAIHGRYTEQRLLGVPYGSLQGVTVRPVPCNYYVIQRVVALSRRRRGFKSRRGRQIITYRRNIYSLFNKRIENSGLVRKFRVIAEDCRTKAIRPRSPEKNGNVRAY